uniref:CX domain-containing protein n=1 Tax=Caenorhabditis tropicalis TaxID=1561998 RepID=A0A1I7UAW6_9PELO
MLLGFVLYFLSFNAVRFIHARDCCNRARRGYVEFTALVSFLHDPQTIDRYFKYNNTNDVYSIERNLTIVFNNNHYFMDDYYEPFENRTRVCLYKFYPQHEEMEHMHYPDGSQPRQMLFGCHSDEECCELGCCTINKYIYFWMFYPIVGTLTFGAYVARKRRIALARLRQLRESMNEP